MLIGAQKVLYDNDPWPLRPQALTQAFERDSQRTDEIQRACQSQRVDYATE